MQTLTLVWMDLYKAAFHSFCTETKDQDTNIYLFPFIQSNTSLFWRNFSSPTFFVSHKGPLSYRSNLGMCEGNLSFRWHSLLTLLSSEVLLYLRGITFISFHRRNYCKISLDTSFIRNVKRYCWTPTTNQSSATLQRYLLNLQRCGTMVSIWIFF